MRNSFTTEIRNLTTKFAQDVVAAYEAEIKAQVQARLDQTEAPTKTERRQIRRRSGTSTTSSVSRNDFVKGYYVARNRGKQVQGFVVTTTSGRTFRATRERDLVRALTRAGVAITA